MHNIDFFISFILFSFPLVIWQTKKVKLLGENTKIHKALHALTGVFLSTIYLAFRYWHTDWYLFSPLHTYALIATLIMPFALAYLVKGTNKARVMAIVMSAILFLSPLTRPFILMGPLRYLGEGVYRTGFLDFEFAIPLNICNISALVYFIALLLPKHYKVTDIIKNYMITLGFFGGFVNNIQVHNTHVNHFWYYFTWESYIVHALIMVIPVFMLLTGQLKMKAKSFTYNLIWLVPMFFLVGLVLNPMVGFNYWFTSPIEFMSFLSGQNVYLTLFGGTVYPMYMLMILMLTLVVSTILYVLFAYIETTFIQYFANERTNFKVGVISEFYISYTKRDSI